MTGKMAAESYRITSRALHYQSGSSDKWYWIIHLEQVFPDVQGALIGYGKVGAYGNWRVEKNKDAHTLFRQKIKKGYEEEHPYDISTHTVEAMKQEFQVCLRRHGIIKSDDPLHFQVGTDNIEISIDEGFSIGPATPPKTQPKERDTAWAGDW